MSRGRVVDAAGACLSGACALHCLAAPLLVGALSGLASEELELALVASAVILASLAAWSGHRVHGRRRGPFAFAAAAAVMGCGRMIGEASAAGHVLVVAGAVGLASAHLLNHRLCRCASDRCRG